MCPSCWAGISAAARLDERFDDTHALAWLAAVDAYDGRMKDIIHALKYDRRRSISPRLGALMRERGAALLHDADCVVPVPLHPRREYRRGFNQAHDLAMHLGPPARLLLRRVRHTHSQMELPRHQRLTNVKDAFTLDPPDGPCGDKPSGLSILPPGLSILPSGLSVVVLVDDVCTTGATLEACARVLRVAGVKEVRALTAARVVSAPPR